MACLAELPSRRSVQPALEVVMPREIIRTKDAPAPAATASQAVKAAEFAFVSGRAIPDAGIKAE
jgi:hypothetical protein